MIDTRRAALVSLLLAASGCATTSPTPPTAEPGSTSVTVRAETVNPAPPAPPAPPRELVTPPAPAPPAAAAPAPPPAPPAPPPAPTAPAPPRPASVGPAAPVPPGPRRMVVFNFDNADVEVVVQAASEIAGFNYVIAPTARGRKVTVQTPGRIPSDEVFAVLLTILDVNGLSAVRSGTLYRIIPREGTPQTAVRTSVGREVDPAVPGDQMLTQIVPLQFIGASEAVTLLRPFVSQPGGLSAHRDTGMLIITDTAANVRRLLDVLALADVQVALQELKIVPLKFADAQEMAQLLTQIFSQRVRGAASPTVSPVSLPAPTPAAPGAAAAPRPPTATADATPLPDRPPQIVAERRSNSLIVNASKPEMETIRRLIEQLDVDIYGGQRVFVYFLENTKARDLASTLDAIYGKGGGPAITGTQPALDQGAGISRGGPTPTSAPPPPAPARPATGGPGQRGSGVAIGEEGGVSGEVKFIADEVTNAIIVTTYPRNWKDIVETIKKLDKMPRQVLIEVLAAEVTLTDDMKLGIEWAIRSGQWTVLNTPDGTVPSRLSRALFDAGGIVNPGLTATIFAADKFLAAINALSADNRINVLSSPSVMTAENKKAVINVSRSVPILTSQQLPVGSTTTTSTGILNNNTSTAIVGTQTVEYRDAGIVLTVTPRIGEEGTVALDVKQEVNDVGNPFPPTNSPEFLKREAETSVVLMNNQTLVLGGLIQNRRSFIRAGIPFLNRLPVIGYLFGSTEEKIERTELLLLITPRVVGTALEAARLTEQMRRITPELENAARGERRPPALPR